MTAFGTRVGGLGGYNSQNNIKKRIGSFTEDLRRMLYSIGIISISFMKNQSVANEVNDIIKA